MDSRPLCDVCFKSIPVGKEKYVHSDLLNLNFVVESKDCEFSVNESPWDMINARLYAVHHFQALTIGPGYRAYSYQKKFYVFRQIEDKWTLEIRESEGAHLA